MDATAAAVLAALTATITGGFNRDDLDAAMAFFADDAVYDEFDGRRHVGRDAIRAAFVPQFRGDFGRIRFHESARRSARRRSSFAERETKRSTGWNGLSARVRRGVERRAAAAAHPAMAPVKHGDERHAS